MEVNYVLKNIRETRKQQKKTLNYMTEKLNLQSAASYCKKELGQTPITLTEYLKICQILGKSPVFFLK